MLNITHYQRNANQNHNEVLSHSSHNACYQKGKTIQYCEVKKLNQIFKKVYKQYVLEKVRRKGNPLTLLVGMQTSTATMENSVEIP